MALQPSKAQPLSSELTTRQGRPAWNRLPYGHNASASERQNLNGDDTGPARPPPSFFACGAGRSGRRRDGEDGRPRHAPRARGIVPPSAVTNFRSARGPPPGPDEAEHGGRCTQFEVTTPGARSSAPFRGACRAPSEVLNPMAAPPARCIGGTSSEEPIPPIGGAYRPLSRLNGLQSWSMLGLDANGCRGERNAASGWEISGRDVVGPAKLSTALARGADGVWDGRDGVACLGALRGCTCLASCVMHRVSGPEPRSLGAKLSTDPARGADGVWDGRDGVACLGALRGCTCSASRVMHRVRGPEPWTTVHRTSYAKPCDARVGGGKIPCSPTQPRSGCHRAGPPCRSRMQALPGATATTPARRCRPALYKPTHHS